MTDPTRGGAALNRRDVAQLLLMAGLAGAPSATSAMAAEDGPFKPGGEELRAFMKLQSRADEGYTNYANTGTVYAAIPGRQSEPMYGYEGLLRFHTRIAGPDAYDVTFIEAGTYLDLTTGERLDRFQNPLTKRENKVDHIVEGPFSWRWTTETLNAPDPSPGLHRRVGWRHLGGQSWLQFDNAISAPLPGGGVFNAAALATYVGSTAEIEDQARASVSDTVLIDSSINPWAPWLEMGDAPGRLASDVTGRKLGAISEAPDRLIAFIAKTRPPVLDDVERWKAAG